MKTKTIMIGGAAAAALAMFAWYRFGRGAAASTVRNDAAGPRLPGMPQMPTMPTMPSMPAMPSMPTMPVMPSMASGAAPNAPRVGGGLFGGLFG